MSETDETFGTYIYNIAIATMQHPDKTLQHASETYETNSCNIRV
jgi:hypothetical protein